MKKFDQEHLSAFDALGNQTQRGDCMRATIAMLVSAFDPSIEISNVPHFYAMSDSPWDEVERWLAPRGFRLRDFPMFVFGPTSESQFSLKELSRVIASGEAYIAAGRSPRSSKITHAIVMRGESLFHDPHPDHSGIQSLTWIYRIERV